MANSKLERTSGATPTLRTKCALAVWVKRSTYDSIATIFGYSSGNENASLRFEADGKLRWKETNSGNSTVLELKTNIQFTDTTSWMHIYLTFDSTQGTASDRCKMYINGKVVPSIYFATETQPSQDVDSIMNGVSDAIKIGTYADSEWFEGGLAQLSFVDGSTPAVTAFGEFSSDTGEWIGKGTISGVTWGNNGFMIRLSNSSDMGEDSSGNNNDFTTAGNLVLQNDSPDNQFPCLMAENQVQGGPIYTKYCNRTGYVSSDTWNNHIAVWGVDTHKWYFEVKVTIPAGKQNYVGVVPLSHVSGKDGTTYTTCYMGEPTNGIGANNSGTVYKGGSVIADSGYAAWTDGDVIGCAVDLDNSKIYWSINGTFQNSGDPTSGSAGTGAEELTASKTYFFGGSTYNSTNNYNFGDGYFGYTKLTGTTYTDGNNRGTFKYSVPTGYKSMCAKNVEDHTTTTIHE